tara:strand:+ start:246 stop:467 length:222 start_codon:yes stop_codon:yes gene_type:complete
VKVGDLVYNILDEGYLGLGLVVPFERAALHRGAYPMASTLEKVCVWHPQVHWDRLTLTEHLRLANPPESREHE